MLCLMLLLAGCSQRVRFATFNAAMSGTTAGEMTARLETGDDPQYRAVAEIIQRTKPDVLLLQEFDHDPSGRAVELFQANYLGVPQNGAEPIEYAHTFSPEVNTGEHSGIDLNNDGIIDPNPGSAAYAADCFGWGTYPGQYGMVVFSRFPIDHDDIRTYRKLTWRQMQGDTDWNLWPENPDGSSYFSDEAKAVLRVSSKTHADVPIRIGGQTVHLLIAHPTPPVFDGPEDRNGIRNMLEVVLLNGILQAGTTTAQPDDLHHALRSDNGLPPRLVRRHVEYDKPWPSRLATDVMSLGIFNFGHLATGSASRNLWMGDLNCDPLDGDARSEARATLAYRVGQTFGVVPDKQPVLVGNSRFQEPGGPASTGAVEAAEAQRGANASHRAEPRFDTADFPDAEPLGPGNLRVDYVIPSLDLKLVDMGVFWPASDDPLHRLVKDNLSSDHRLVWVDVKVPR
jgi:endonuclease/exonuclease/phosphatase family metal-dependent hydrolase